MTKYSVVLETVDTIEVGMTVMIDLWPKDQNLLHKFLRSFPV